MPARCSPCRRPRRGRRRCPRPRRSPGKKAARCLAAGSVDMARGRQLSQLLDQLQAEAGMSLLPASATSSKDHRVQVLNRVQDRLYKAFDWDFAFIKRDVPTVIGDRYLNLPADIELERVNYVRISNGTAGNDW